MIRIGNYNKNKQMYKQSNKKIRRKVADKVFSAKLLVLEQFTTKIMLYQVV